MLLSVISPVYNSDASLIRLVQEINDAVATVGQKSEIIFVDDGSSDRSWSKIESLCREQKNIGAVKLLRNFGQQAAILAGLEASSGDFVVLLDCDLQDDPKYIPALFSKALEGYPIVFAAKTNRQHTVFRNFAVICFEGFLKQRKQIRGVGTYSLLRRDVVKAILENVSSSENYVLKLRRLEHRKAFVPVLHRARPYGKSAYTTAKLVKHALQWLFPSSKPSSLPRYVIEKSVIASECEAILAPCLAKSL